MPKENDINTLFRNLGDALDLEQPRTGHEQRFDLKLNALHSKKEFHLGRWILSSRIQIAAAASIILMVTLSVLNHAASSTEDVSLSVYAPELSATSAHFGDLISQKVDLLKSENTDQVRPVVEAALTQLKDLESDYRVLERDVLDGGNTELILHAMLRNFQTRLSLIESVLRQIEHLKETQNDEQIL